MPRTFAPISEEDFAEEFLQKIMEEGSDYDKKRITQFLQTKNYNCIEAMCSYFSCVSIGQWCDIHTQFIDDIEANVYFSCENMYCHGNTESGTSLVGFHTLDNDFTFLGFEVWGDWEGPLVLIMYWDGENFRGYVPKNGNSWNYINNKAFGNDLAADWEYLEKYCPEKAAEIRRKIETKEYQSDYYDYDHMDEKWLIEDGGFYDVLDDDFYFCRNVMDDDKMLEEIEQNFQLSQPEECSHEEKDITPKTFASTTEKEFAMRFLAVLMEDDSHHKEKITKIFQKEQDYVKTVYEYMDSDTPLYSDVFDQFFTDLDVEFCFENHHCSPRRSKILGFRTLDNGLTFLGIEAAGDWEIAVTCIMYWDGNDFRGYVPKNGNCWNYINNEAFWNDRATDWKYLKQYYPKKAQAIEQKAQGIKWNGDWGTREAWLASSDWADYDFYYGLIDEDKMMEEIEQVFQLSSVSTSKKIEVECKKEQTNVNNREKMIVEDKNGNFKLVIGYYSPAFDYDMEDDSLSLEDAIEKALKAQEPQDEDEVWGKNDYMILYNANGDILQKVDGQEIVDCICSKYGESLYEVDIMKYAIAEFLMAYYNVDIVKIDNFEYNKQEIEKRGKIKFKF